MFATTDGFSGLCGSWDTPGTGINFLAHNMCRLSGSEGTWMVVEGGMGSVTQQLALRATEAGAVIDTNAHVDSIDSSGNVATGVTVRSGRDAKAEDVSMHRIKAKTVIVNADPFRLRELLPADALPKDVAAKLDGMRMEGMTMKVQLRLMTRSTKPMSGACLQPAAESASDMGRTLHSAFMMR
jgi:phytoene dehydrogenase-like protein